VVGTSSGLSLIGLLRDLSNFPKGPPGFVCCVYRGDEILPSFTGDYELHKPSQGYISKNQPENSNGKSPLGPRFFFPKRLHLWRLSSHRWPFHNRKTPWRCGWFFQVFDVASRNVLMSLPESDAVTSVTWHWCPGKMSEGKGRFQWMDYPGLKRSNRTWKWMVSKRIFLSFWEPGKLRGHVSFRLGNGEWINGLVSYNLLING